MLSKDDWRSWRQEGVAAVAERIRRLDPLFADFSARLHDFTPFFPLPALILLVRDWARDGLLLIGDAAPVVTEAMYLLGFSTEAQDELWSLLESGRLHLLGLDASDAPRMRALMRKYRDLPMDLAHASLVAVAERDGPTRFTLDRRDFGVYRPAKLGRFSIIP